MSVLKHSDVPATVSVSNRSQGSRDEVRIRAGPSSNRHDGQQVVRLVSRVIDPIIRLVIESVRTRRRDVRHIRSIRLVIERSRDAIIRIEHVDAITL